jgi:hypothetical protein
MNRNRHEIEPQRIIVDNERSKVNRKRTKTGSNPNRTRNDSEPRRRNSLQTRWRFLKNAVRARSESSAISKEMEMRPVSPRRFAPVEILCGSAANYPQIIRKICAYFAAILHIEPRGKL